MSEPDDKANAPDDKSKHAGQKDDGLTEHLVAMADEELPLDDEALTMDKVREMARHQHEPGMHEPDALIEFLDGDSDEDQLTLDKIREMTEHYHEPEAQGSESTQKQPAVQKPASESEIDFFDADEDEKLTLDQISEMAKNHHEPGMPEPKKQESHKQVFQDDGDDEELTLDQIREMAKHYHEPGMKEAKQDDEAFEDKPEPVAITQEDRWQHELRARLHEVLFEMRTPVGKLVNYSILVLIVAVVFTTMLSTVESTPKQWVDYFQYFEYFVLYVFLIEYVLRVYAAKHRWDYIRSFNGVVDFLTVLPLVIAGQGAVAVRLLRLLRLIKVTTFFPVLKSLLMSVSGALNLLMAVIGTIGLVSLLVGNLIYLVEPETFSNAFEGLWWSLVTMSTVGYGDIVPQSLMGKILAGTLILTGIVMFAMVTAVISVRVGRMVHMNARCLHCDKQISPEYEYCPYCGENQADDIDLFGSDDD